MSRTKVCSRFTFFSSANLLMLRSWTPKRWTPRNSKCPNYPLFMDVFPRITFQVARSSNAEVGAEVGAEQGKLAHVSVSVQTTLDWGQKQI